MSGESGLLTFRTGSNYYSLRLQDNGRRAAEMVQFLDDIYKADSFEKGILKFIGFTVEISRSRPSRRAKHWVEIDLDKKVLATNSSLIKEAVGHRELEEVSSLSDFARKRIYTALDSLDFSVQLYR